MCHAHKLCIFNQTPHRIKNRAYGKKKHLSHGKLFMDEQKNIVGRNLKIANYFLTGKLNNCHSGSPCHSERQRRISFCNLGHTVNQNPSVIQSGSEESHPIIQGTLSFRASAKNLPPLAHTQIKLGTLYKSAPVGLKCQNSLTTKGSPLR